MITTEITKRIIKVFIYDFDSKSTKHVKSLPLLLENVFKEIPEHIFQELDSKKTLSDSDIEKVSEFVFDGLANEYLDFLKKHEPYVFELTQNNPIIGTREVKERNFKSRYELVFKDKFIKIKCPIHIHKFSKNKLEIAKLNY